LTKLTYLLFLYFSETMPLSAAEKQSRYRQRRDADQARRAEYLEKEKERYRQLKETGKSKTKNEMTAS
jgi:hypothetical protein